MQHYELLKEYMDSCNRERYRDHEQIRLTDMPANAGFVDDEWEIHCNNESISWELRQKHSKST